MLMCIASKIRKAVKPSIFLGGSCADANAWRKEIIKEFKSKFSFIDPYDTDWYPEKNIYEELTGIYKADHVVFYRGGEGTKKEKEFMKVVDKKYEDFKDLDKLKAFLKRI